MFQNTLDNYAHNNNLKDVNVYFKVIFAMSTMIVSLVSTSPVTPFIIAFLLYFIIIFKAKIPWKFYLKFLVIPISFALLTFIFMAIFFGVGSRIMELGVFNLAITVDGFNLGLLIFARIMGCFTCLVFLSLTTPLNELFLIMEHFKIPKIVLEIAMLMYRYIFVFLDEAINMYHSQETRLGYSSLRKTFKSLGMLGSNLFIIAWIKGEQAFVAMESRCYDGSINTIKKPDGFNKIKVSNMLLLFLFEAFLIISAYITGSLKIF